MVVWGCGEWADMGVEGFFCVGWLRYECAVFVGIPVQRLKVGIRERLGFGTIHVCCQMNESCRLS